MSAIPIGTLAIDLIAGGGGAGKAGAIAGVVAAVTNKILGVIGSMIRKVFDLIKKGIQKILSEKGRLAAFDPVAAYAGAVTMIGQLLRDISRARFLGPALLDLAQAVNTLRNILEPFIQGVLKIAINAFTNLVVSVMALVGLLKDTFKWVMKYVRAIVETASALLNFSSYLKTAVLFFQQMPLMPKTPVGVWQLLLADIARRMKEIRKELAEANDQNKLGGSNELFMQDLRWLTEGATKYNLVGQPTRIKQNANPYDYREHDLFGS